MSANQNHRSIGEYASLPTSDSDAGALPLPATTTSQRHWSTCTSGEHPMLPKSPVSFDDIFEQATPILEQTEGLHHDLDSDDDNQGLDYALPVDGGDHGPDCIDEAESSIFVTDLLTKSSATVVTAVIYGALAWISSQSRAEASKQAITISGVHKQSAKIESTLEAAYWICCIFFFATMLIAPVMADCAWGFQSRGVIAQRMRAAAMVWGSLSPL